MADRNTIQYTWQGLLLIALLGGFAGTLQAAIPDGLNYEGYLTDSAGSPVDATVSVTFSLYNASAGGIALWSDTRQVSVSKGLFSVTLGGAGNPFPPGLFDAPLWLGLTVEGDGEMVPRIALSSAAFAHKADDTLTLEGSSASSLDQSAHVGDTGNPHNVTAAQAGAVSSASFLAHTGEAGAHHARYTDAEAIAAMGAPGNANPLHHARYADSEAVAAIKAADGAGSTLDADLLDGKDSSDFMSAGADSWVDTAGDTMTGALTVNADINTTTAYQIRGVTVLQAQSGSLSVGEGAGLLAQASPTPFWVIRRARPTRQALTTSFQALNRAQPIRQAPTTSFWVTGQGSSAPVAETSFSGAGPVTTKPVRTSSTSTTRVPVPRLSGEILPPVFSMSMAA